MHLKERIIGFDIRYTIDYEVMADRIAKNYPYINTPRAYNTYVWPSHFREPDSSEYPCDPLKTNFREPRFLSNDGKFAVYDSYSERFYRTNLWENLGNMLLRFPPDLKNDHVAMFTLFEFDEPTIYCYGDINFVDKVDIFETLISGINTIDYADLIFPKKIYRNQWHFRGYDVTNGESIFITPPVYWHKIGVGYERNEFGLITNFERALKECQIMNDWDREHNPYFILGVYEAIDINKLSFV